MKRFLSVFFTVVFVLFAVSALADSSGTWKQGNYVDSYGSKTGEKFVYTETKGVFRNTVARNSDLSVRIIVDYSGTEFYLLEYDKFELTNFFDNPSYTIRIKDGNGVEHTMTGVLSEEVGRIHISSEYRNEMMEIFKAGGDIYFSIQDDHMTSTSYTFAILNSSGFFIQWKLAVGLPIGYASSVHEGIVAVTSNGKMGAIDIQGNVIIPCEYDIVDDCSGGMLRVYNGTYTEAEGGIRVITEGCKGKWGFVNKDGELAVPLMYDSAWDFSCGRTFVEKNGKWGCIDTTGTVVIPFKYDYVRSNYCDDVALVYTGTMRNGRPDQGTFYYIDLDGNVIFKTSKWSQRFNEGLACVCVDGKYGYIDTTGKLVIKAQWDDAGTFYNGFAWVRSGTKTSIIDTTGKVVAKVQADNLQSVGSFSEEMAYIWSKDYRYGFINAKGKVIVPCIYRFVGKFHNGHAYVENEDRKYGIIDKNGKFTVPCKWDGMMDCGDYFRVQKFSGSNIGGKYGLIDGNGNVVLDCIYSTINYNDGYYSASLNSEWMIFNENLERIY